MLDQRDHVQVRKSSSAAPVDHLVLFYDDNAALIDRVAAFAREGLRGGDTVVLVATPEHLAAITPRLKHGTGRLIALDAAETLELFCTDGVIDRGEFDAVIGRMVREAGGDGCRVRAFGEMVALLWDAGHVSAAVELEGMWCNLRTDLPFTLLSAYPSDVLCSSALDDALNDLCELHSDVRLTAKDPHPSTVHAFAPTLEAVSEARHFVEACVPQLDDMLLADARLIVTELAANAVHHAATPFVVEMVTTDTTVRISVRDGIAHRPRPRPIGFHKERGRGIAIVKTLSTRWGIKLHANGKTVWAELSL